jgi:signal transduction histidine kinase
MAALFAVTIVPILGWSVVVDLAEHLALAGSELSSATAAGRSPISAAALAESIDQAKNRLVVVLGLSLFTLAAASLYLRRVLVSPLESLSERARRASERWQTPPECARADEIGDLARALDQSVRELAERVERARRFAADLSHELRTPLAAIQGAAELLANEDLSALDVRRFNENVLRESQRLGRLVEGILELERGAPPARRANVACDLVASIREVVESLKLLALRKELSFELRVPEPPALAQVDADRHNRVLFALLENALKFSPDRETIEIQIVLAPEGRYGVSVSDRGHGIAPAQRERIFERHVQDASAAGQRGTGLGLAIAKALVESWGGQIHAEERPGGGARFHYDVPSLPLANFAGSTRENEH